MRPLEESKDAYKRELLTSRRLTNRLPGLGYVSQPFAYTDFPWSRSVYPSFLYFLGREGDPRLRRGA